MPKPDADALSILTSCAHEFQASLVVSALEQAGIRAVLTGVLTAGFRAEAPGRVQVLVHAVDLPAARQVLADLATQRDSVDWSQIDVGAPEDSGESA